MEEPGDLGQHAQNFVQFVEACTARLEPADCGAGESSSAAIFFEKADAHAASPRTACNTGCLPVVCMQRITVPRDRVERGMRYNLLWY